MMRRALDVACAAIALTVLSPFFVVIAAAIKVGDGGSVFFRPTRIGEGGKSFRLWKFRTMVEGAQNLGPGITVQGDSRITQLGKKLRSWKMDELPQLFNVLLGEMSLVGPRPEDARYVALYDDAQREVLKYKPGLTSPASMLYKDEESILAGDDWEEAYIGRILPEKLKIDAAYCSTRTIWADLRIVAQTFWAIAQRSESNH